MDPVATQSVSSQLTFAGLPLLAWIPLLPLLGALFNLTFGRRLSRSTIHTVAIGAVVAACGLSLYLVFGPLLAEFREGRGGIGIAQTVYTWIEVGSFKVQLAFHLDTLSAVMILVVTFVGALIHIYSVGYMAHDPRYAAFFGYLNLFTGAMLILVLASNMPVMFIGWEGVGLCSFLLIAFWYENEAFAAAGRKAFVVNRIGDFAFLLGMFLLYWATKDVNTGDHGSLDFSVLSHPSTWALPDAIDPITHLKIAHADPYIQPLWFHEHLAAAAGILLFIGACGKSAQLPLYVWLPDAMAGPTPVSALIHAATMVTAGVYMVVRMSVLYSASTTAMSIVALVGLLTALSAAFMAFAQTDLKKVLAYSTISQLGFMFVAAGTGHWVAAIFHLATHAFFKACLFLGAGSVMHGMEHGGSTTPGDIMTMGGLRKHMPITRATFLVSCLAITGIFPFAGFFSKDEILGGAWSVAGAAHPEGWPDWYGYVLWGGLLIGALGTAFYMWRLYFLVFSGNERSEPAKHAHESPWTMWAPLVILALFATIAGFIGVPHLEHPSLPAFTHGLATWLDPSVAADFYKAGPINHEPSDVTTIVLMATALVVAGLGIGLAYVFYGRGPSKTVARWVAPDGQLHAAYEASRNKLWVDEIYEAIILKPFRLLARGLFEIVDRFIIDTVAVNGMAFVVSLFSRLSRWIQNGQVQRYLVGVVLGAALMFYITDCRQQRGLDDTPVGTQLQLHANTGAGLLRLRSTVTWDVNGDGKEDLDAAGNPIHDVDRVLRAGEWTTGGTVTVWIDDHIHGKQRFDKIILDRSTTPPQAEAGGE